ncbi:hypothetical protein H6P81_004758 [Aristolochia fimbriata]|uniref:Sec-independent protein translocase protein TatA n=1 Tax=Aristolochia fimbriata TaxID=158543 RepID=A0AAV7ETZ7_ARIFI|nr:hypothetical protein H6P81_004758 [Aristolochia fimbriata]
MAISSASISVHLVPRIPSPRSYLEEWLPDFKQEKSPGPKGAQVQLLFWTRSAGVVILVFGPKKLPEIGRSAGKTVKSFQQAASEFAEELKKAPEESTESPPEQSVASGEDKEAGEKEKPEDSGVKVSLLPSGFFTR